MLLLFSIELVELKIVWLTRILKIDLFRDWWSSENLYFLVSVFCYLTSEFIRMSCCSRKTMVPSKNTKNYIYWFRSEPYVQSQRKIECVFLGWMLWSSYNGVRKKSEGGRRVESDCPNGVSRVYPLRRVPWLPLYRLRGQTTYKELGSPDREVVSLREGEI
jgi:hypothetical protein